MAQPATALVPWPEKITFQRGTYTLDTKAAIVFDPASKVTAETAAYLRDRLAEDAKVAPALKPSNEWKGAGIRFVQEGDATLGPEGYGLVVDAKGILVKAGTPAGLFYGAQTVRQLIGRSFPAKVPYSTITDRPRFAWRGYLLDVSRHFRDVAFVKRQIDLLAFHKMNRFHWHIVDDQGWRLEILAYPKLTEIGAWREEKDGKYGGFYTQDEVREVVAYAKSRFVEVVPEIEMPGHCVAALAAYPEFSCTGGPFKVPTTWGVFDDVYCAGNEETFTFNKKILEETIALFPSKFIHIGGDEVPKTRWKACAKCQARIKAEGLKHEYELQSYFIKRIDKWLADRGRRMIGWDEILEGGLAPGATVQSWRGMEGAIAAARLGHDVIVSPTSHCYLDYSYEAISVQKAYAFEPVPPQLTAAQARHVLGGEGNMWGERTPLPKDTDRMTFPRLSALAEVFWSPKAGREWAKFEPRLDRHLDTLAAMGVKFYIEPPRLAAEDNVFIDRLTISLEGGGPIVYTLDGSEPTAASARYSRPLTITQTTTLKASTMRGRAVGAPMTQTFRKVVPIEPMPPARALVNGIKWEYFEGGWSVLPDFAYLKPVASGFADVIDVSPAKREDEFALLFTGYFKAEKDGIYTFYLTSDDGSRLWISTELVVDHDGLHAASEKTGQVALRSGWHPIRIAMFEAGGAQALSVAVRPPGSPKRPVVATDLGR